MIAIIGAITNTLATTDGYILNSLRLYQLSNLSKRPNDKAYPEQKKKIALPIAPPVAKAAYFP